MQEVLMLFQENIKLIKTLIYDILILLGGVIMDLTYVGDNNKSNSFTILISMHLIDRYIFFDSLANNILANNNCNICYSSSPLDTAKINMENIDLVIIGVTEKYIVWNNSGFVSETLKAIETKIPILPIMLEPGIVNLFNTRCGKFHYIENFDNKLSDNTLLQINNHIQSLSNSNLVSDDNGKPKIFISYRKKDIQSLNRLVKLIDAHPDRDKISMWYDTNLHPGDNYSLTIINQLKTCDLFLMLVTPNILEPNNYVMRIEYPLALKERKQILPIAMEKTDLKQLYSLYPNLPKCITDTQIGGIFSKLK